MFLLCFAIDSNAQEQLTFGKIGVGQGLSQGIVTSICQDSEGFLWFGTKDGLNKYNGYEFEVYLHDISKPNSLANSDISNIYEDSDSILWVATDGGLSKYDRKNNHFVNYTEGLLSLSVRVILEASADELWVGTYLGGLHKFNKNTEEFTSYSVKEGEEARANANIRSLRKVGDGKIWVGSEDGIKLFNTESEKYMGKISLPKSSNLAESKTNQFFTDWEGHFWVGTYGGGLKMLPQDGSEIKEFTAETGVSTGLSNNFVLSIAQSEENKVWIGTSYGLNIYNTENQVFQTFTKDNSINSISSNRIRALLVDNLGILWVGTDNGISFYDPNREKFQSRGNSPRDLQIMPNNNIGAIYSINPDQVLLGTEGGGLIVFNSRLGTATVWNKDNSSLPSDVITAILQADNQYFWIGTEADGIVRLNIETGEGNTYQYSSQVPYSISSNNIKQLRKSNSGGLWIATDGGGLNHFDSETEKFKSYKTDAENPASLTSNFITSVLDDGNGTVWIGTYGGGLNKLDVAKKTFRVFKNEIGDSSSLSSNIINALYLDKAGDVWIGTYAGLNKINPNTNAITLFNIDNSSSNYVIQSILGDEANGLWLSSNKGLVHFEREKGVFRTYDVRDGLPSNQFFANSAHKSANGQLLFGGLNGYTFFNPSKIKDNLYQPSVLLTRFLLDNTAIQIYSEETAPDSPLKEAISEAKYIELSHEQRDFSIEFTALNFRLPEKNKYRYKLVGFKDEWTYTDADKRLATYTNLEPKEYTFIVEASNNDGVWSAKSANLVIKIVPAWWDTLLAKTIAVILLGLLAFFIYKMRVRRVERVQRELKALVRTRTKEIELKNDELYHKAEELAAQKEEILQINDRLESAFDELEKEKDKSEAMLLNILPRETAKELKEKGSYTPRHYKMVTVLFSDFKGFTSIAEKLSPNELIEELDYFFQYFDKVSEKHDLEKIKTIGDAYMCAGGIPKPNVTNPVDVILAALEIVAFSNRINQERLAKGQTPWELRVGINTGELVAGVVGKKKFAYDVWGDAVNLASRMESSGEPGRVNISGNTHEIVKGFFDCEYRGKVHAKGKGDVDMYYVNKIKPELSLDADGFSPNADFRIKVKELLMKASQLASKE